MRHSPPPPSSGHHSIGDELNYIEKAANDDNYGPENGPGSASGVMDYRLELRQNASEYRQAFSAAGIDLYAVGWMGQSEASNGDGTTTVASFKPDTKKINMIEYDHVVSIAEANSKNLRVVITDVLNHEKNHREAHEVLGSMQVNLLISILFGPQAVHDIEEAAASIGTTDYFDAYGRERSRAASYARELGISLEELIRIKLGGDYRSLLIAAIQSGKILPNQLEQPSSDNILTIQQVSALDPLISEAADSIQQPTNHSSNVYPQGLTSFPVVSNPGQPSANDQNHRADINVTPLTPKINISNNQAANNPLQERKSA